MGMNSLKHLVSAILFASLLLGCGSGDSNSGLDKSRTEITEDSEALTVAEPSTETVDDDEESVVDELNLVEQTANSLRVTAPNGGEKWTTGKSYAIKWKRKKGNTVRIRLLKSGKHYKWISKKTKNDGKHIWKIPATVATGSAYKIKIVFKGNKKIFDTSNKNFKITNADSLEVISPNGGETWKKGSVVSIKWEKGSIGGKVGVYLYKSGKRYRTITVNTANDGKESWTVPTTLATGSAYKVRVQSKTAPTNSDFSDRNFTISAPIVTLSCNASSASESGGKIACTLELSSSTTKTVKIKTAYSGSATAGTDYSGNKTTHTISAGKTSTSWTLTGKSDTKTEGNETIVINVTSVTNAKESDTQRESITLTDSESTW